MSYGKYVWVVVATTALAWTGAATADSLTIMASDDTGFTYGGGTVEEYWPGMADSSHFLYAASADTWGQWTFTGLTDGTYKVWDTWQVTQASTVENWTVQGALTGTADQSVLPYRSAAAGDLHYADLSSITCVDGRTSGVYWYLSDWQLLTSVAQVTSGSLTVRLDGTIYARFDAIGIERVGPVIPEPSTLALFVSGLLGLLAYAWRKRR